MYIPFTVQAEQQETGKDPSLSSKTDKKPDITNVSSPETPASKTGSKKVRECSYFKIK